MIKLVGMDLDGTLLNSLLDLTDAVNFALQKESLSRRSIEEVKQFIGNGVYLLLQRAAAPITDVELLQRLKEHFDKYYSVHYCDKSVLYDGIRDLLIYFQEQEIDVAVYSNKPAEFVIAIMDKLFPVYPFAAILGQNKDFPTKPDATQFKLLQKKYGFANEECCYIGDSEVDVQTAKNAGVRFIGVDWGYSDSFALKQAGAELIVHTVDEIKTILLS